MNEQQTITTDDARVQFLAEETGETPAEILTEAGDAAVEDGISLSAELDGGVEFVKEVDAEFAEMEAELGDGTDNDGDDWL